MQNVKELHLRLMKIFSSYKLVMEAVRYSSMCNTILISLIYPDSNEALHYSKNFIIADLTYSRFNNANIITWEPG